MITPPDQEDVADLQALRATLDGRPDEFGRLVDRHSGRCLAAARRVLVDEDMAQDAVQEAYLELWRNADRFDPARSSLGPWLVMLTHRRAVDRVRLERRRPRPVGEPADTASDYDLEQHALTSVLGSQAVELLARVPAAQRECLVLAYWGGYTMVEIARQLQLPVGTVKTRCRSALRSLRTLVDEHGLAVA